MTRPLEVLLIEDQDDDAILIGRYLSRAGYEPRIRRVETEAAMRAELVSQQWDIILSDYMLPGFDCPGALGVLKESGLDIPLIALSGTVDEDTIIALVRAGARDYVMKDNLARLPSAVERELKEAEGRRQRKRLEQQLLQAQKMEAIGRLAGGVAHDFNNLLTVITGFAQLALLDEQPSREGIEQILEAAERAAGLTRQLLAFSRQQAMQVRVFDLNQLVKDGERLLRRLIGEDIQVITRLSQSPVPVKADPGQIEQVILNLAINSRDAMPSGGKLIISTSHRLLDEAYAKILGIQAGEYCVIAVSDNGIGIPADALPHVFEPFFTTKPEGQGTGLGLSTVYGIVQQSGGYIRAYSEQDMGTTMTVYLPSANSTVIAPEVLAQKEVLPKGTETVLVAEDDPSVLRLVSESLAARGFRVLRAENGEKALELLSLHQRGERIDVLVTDVVMPGMPGPELATSASGLFPELKILFMSGYTEDVIQHHGISRGTVAFIQKPFAPGDLVRKVRQLLDREPTEIVV